MGLGIFVNIISLYLLLKKKGTESLFPTRSLVNGFGSTDSLESSSQLINRHEIGSTESNPLSLILSPNPGGED